MLSDKVLEALNNQIRDEFYASFVYLSMAAYFEDKNLPGMSQWMRVQAEEEHTHAMKIYDFVLDRDGQVRLQAVKEPPSGFDSPLAAFRGALDNERAVTESIHSMYELAKSHNDYATQVMLEWFIEEQVEEEKVTGDVVAQLEMAGDNPTALLVLDSQLGARAPDAGPGA